MTKINEMTFNEEGHLTIDGLDVVDLVESFGTPLYVVNENTVRENCRMYKNALQKHYSGKFVILYASKALSCMEMCRIVNSEGLGLDVSSGGELYTAIKAGFPMDKVHFHGNNKTINEINLAVENKVGRIVVDNIFELETIDSIARKKGIKIKISLRIKPGINVRTHDFIKTADSNSKFGFDLKSGEAIEAIKFAKALQNVELRQLHCHIGSQILEVTPFVKAAETMMHFIYDVHRKLMIKIPEINFGGGVGIKYTDNDIAFEFERFIKETCDIVKFRSEQYGMEPPSLYMEPGRSIVGEAGITLYKIGSIKEIEGIKTLVSVDGGMGDNPRHMLYGADYNIVFANKPNIQKSVTATIVGRYCENGDVISEDIKVPPLDVGDIIAVLCTGAYNYSMSSNYNRVPRPPIIMIRAGEPRIVVKGETYEDIIRNDI